jgi:hypothetical protein
MELCCKHLDTTFMGYYFKRGKYAIRVAASIGNLEVMSGKINVGSTYTSVHRPLQWY